MARHPYTYAADFIRNLAGYNDSGSKLSRSDAAVIHAGIAEALGMDKEVLACKLSEYYQKHESELTAKAVRDFAISRASIN